MYPVVVETKNRSLEETAALFDGEEVAEQIAAAAHVSEGKDHSSVDEKEKA